MERRPLAALHGAEGWALPAGRGAIDHGVWPAVGDASEPAVGLTSEVATDAASGTWLEVGPLLERWGQGEANLAAPVVPLLRLLAQAESTAGLWDSLVAFDAEALGGAWEVSPGIWMLPVETPTLPPASHTNSFLIGGDLVSAPLWIEPCARRPEPFLGAGPKAMIPTHHHPDHIGGIGAGRRAGVELWAHEATGERLGLALDRTLREGDVLNAGDGRVPLGRDLRLEVLYTPGHAPGHLCFWEPQSRTVIVGDMVAGVGTILVEPRDGDMAAYLDSLARLRDLGAARMLPAHGGLIVDPAAHLSRYIEHRLAREEKVRRALVDRPGSAPGQLVAGAYPELSPVHWPLAAQSIHAHLIKLAGDGKAERRGKAWWPR